MYARSFILAASFFPVYLSERLVCVYVYLYSPHKRSDFTSSIFDLGDGEGGMHALPVGSEINRGGDLL